MVSKSVKTLCRPAPIIRGREAPPEEPQLQSEETDINMPRKIPTVLGPISLPRPIPIPSKMQTPAQLNIQRTIGKYTGRKTQEAQPDTTVDTGNDVIVLEPEIHIHTDADFVIPPSLDKVVDSTKIVHTFLPKQGEVECLLKQINRKVL